MNKNMGTADRWLRAAVVAPVLIVWSAIVGLSSALGIVLLVGAAVMLATAGTGFCPLYRLFKLDTRRQQREDAVASL
ncbi:MAG: DUF2892 domain-containing protein [Nitriliruptorales bacterium]|nr:DUF2892 domain-containing protein [Nitriliruptorales bacterium]